MHSPTLTRLLEALAPLHPPGPAAPFDRTAYSDVREAAVLILLYPRAGEPHLVLTRRTSHLPDHSGQISLPGGQIDPGDASAVAAALRETREEIGVPTDHLTLWGPLQPIFTVASNFLVQPFVGLSTTPLSFTPSAYEVAEVIELPLEHLFLASTAEEEVWTVRGARRRVGYYRYREHQIWGLTARILSQIVALVGAPTLPPGQAEPGETIRLRDEPGVPGRVLSPES